jgi:hypothetical protein
MKPVTRYQCELCWKLFYSPEECLEHEEKERQEKEARAKQILEVETQAIKAALAHEGMRCLVNGGQNETAREVAIDILCDFPWAPDSSAWYEGIAKRMIAAIEADNG